MVDRPVPEVVENIFYDLCNSGSRLLVRMVDRSAPEAAEDIFYDLWISDYRLQDRMVDRSAPEVVEKIFYDLLNSDYKEVDFQEEPKQLRHGQINSKTLVAQIQIFL